MFNSKAAIEVNKRILLYKKLKEQQEQMKIREQIQEAERHKIDVWWDAEQKKIIPWSVEQRAFYTKFTFSPDEKTSESWIRSRTNQWKQLQNR